MTPLFAHQRKFLTKNPDMTSLIWSCGTGKTRTACEWAKKGKDRALVICPKALVANWEREAGKWGARVYVMSKENFRRDHKGTPWFGQVIIDEVHNGFLTPRFKSQMSKALRFYLSKHNPLRVLLLSATPYTSSPWNIFNLAHYTSHKWNYREFETAFFDYVRMGSRIIFQPKKGSEEKLAKLVKKIASVVSLEECVDVPTQTYETEYFELTREQKKEIDGAYDPLPIIRFTKSHEIENGILKGNEFVPDKTGIPCLKNERIKSLCEENKKIIIVCRYNLQIDFLRKFLAPLEKPVFVIRGDVKDRDAVVQEAEKSNEAIVLIQAACSAGYELPSFRVMVFASMDYSFVNYQQMQGRILRINNLQKNVYLHLICGEIDEAVLEAVKKKKDFDIKMYAHGI